MNIKTFFRKFMVPTVNVIISLVIDLVALYVGVMVHVTVVHANVIQSGGVTLVIAMILIILVLWITAMRYVLVVVIVNAVNVSVMRKMALDILENTVKNVR